MLIVTPRAKVKLRRDLNKARDSRFSYARIIYSTSNPARIGFALDDEREDDQVITDNEGEKLLLIGSDMVQFLNDIIIDYCENPDKRSFLIMKVDDPD